MPISSTLLKIQSVRSCSHYTHRCKRTVSRVTIIPCVMHIFSLPHLVFFSHSSDVVIKENPGLSVILFAWYHWKFRLDNAKGEECCGTRIFSELFGIKLHGNVSEVVGQTREVKRFVVVVIAQILGELFDVVNRNRTLLCN